MNRNDILTEVSNTEGVERENHFIFDYFVVKASYHPEILQS